MSVFVRANSYSWDKANQSKYKNSIVFIEDSKQIYSNGVYYGGENNIRLDKIEFSEESITLEPDKFYVSYTVLETLDITLNGDTTRMNTYFVEFLCDNTCIILPSNIKWENNIVPDFTKTAIMTIKIQDDTAYLIDCRPFYSVQYTATKKVQPNRTDAFGSEIVGITEDEFILNSTATEIKENAFEGNQDLISITIPNTVKRIGSKAFSGCSNLQDMEYEGSSKDWNNIDLGEDWNEGTQVESVECADGDVYLESYITFTAEEDNSSIGLAKLSANQTLEYSTDTTAWTDMDISTTITLPNVGDKVYVRGILSGDNTKSNYTRFKMSGKIAASGNCNAIWNYQDLNAPLKAYCGYCMFNECTSLTTAPELPATELAESCYTYMFKDCSSLTAAPELPATILANSCYNHMFTYCRSLVTVPELPATELAERCYDSMFYNCASLVTAPELPATTLTDYCYHSMFESCISLTTAPELPATTLADSCYYRMFRYCKLTAAPELPATTLTDYCYHAMFESCRYLTTTPEILPATTLASNCYSQMFSSCTSLTTVPELPATTLANYCYSYMFQGCTSLTTAPELSATTLAERCYQYMFNNCTKLNYIKCLATDISAANCTSNWVYKISSTGTFVKHPNMNSWTTGTNGIPSGWTIKNVTTSINPH